MRGARHLESKRTPINFAACGIPKGSVLEYVEDSAVQVTVYDDRKVLYKDQITSLSAIVEEIKGVSSIAGPSYFTYKGELLTDIANRTQWKDY